MKRSGFVTLKFPEKDPQMPAESFLSTWLGLPSIALGLFALLLVLSANLGMPIGPRALIEQEKAARAEYRADGSLHGYRMATYFVLSSDGWLCIAVGSALGFLGAAERKGRSRLSLTGLLLNLVAFVACWFAIFGLLA